MGGVRGEVGDCAGSGVVGGVDGGDGGGGDCGAWSGAWSAGGSRSRITRKVIGRTPPVILSLTTA